MLPHNIIARTIATFTQFSLSGEVSVMRFNDALQIEWHDYNALDKVIQTAVLQRQQQQQQREQLQLLQQPAVNSALHDYTRNQSTLM